MPDGVSFGKIVGLEELVKQLNSLKDIDIVKCLEAGGYKLMEGSMRRCPVDTGNMRNSHAIVPMDDSVEMHVNTDYAVHVHWGTSKQQPQPWINITIDEDADQIVQACANEAEKQIQAKLG